MPAIEMRTSEIPGVYKRLATAIGAEHWRGAVAKQQEAVRRNPFLEQYLQTEYDIAYHLDELRALVARCGTIPLLHCNNPKYFPAAAFSAQVLDVLNQSSTKQARTFVKRVRNAFTSAENMHGLHLELQAATHFMSRGYQVSWHRGTGAGTFDLMIRGLGKDGLEVECKAISEDKGRRIHRMDALEFWGELWKDIEKLVQNLSSGLAVVLTVPKRLPSAAEGRAALAREVTAQILTGSGESLAGGAELSMVSFDTTGINTALGTGAAEVRKVVDSVTGTTNREVAFYGTPKGGVLVLVMQSKLPDDLLDQVFATLGDSAGRQFTRTRGGLFWVGLNGIGPNQLRSLHGQQLNGMQQPTALASGASNFLAGAPDHIVGVVFASRNSLVSSGNGTSDLGGSTHFFLNDKSPHWHPSFRSPLRLEEEVS